MEGNEKQSQCKINHMLLSHLTTPLPFFVVGLIFHGWHASQHNYSEALCKL